MGNNESRPPEGERTRVRHCPIRVMLRSMRLMRCRGSMVAPLRVHDVTDLFSDPEDAPEPTKPTSINTQPPLPSKTKDDVKPVAPKPKAPPKAPEPELPKEPEKPKEPVKLTNERRKQCYMWYARLGQPNKKKMKEKVAALPESCDITPEEVEALPWVAGGMMLSVKEMNKLFLNPENK